MKKLLSAFLFLACVALAAPALAGDPIYVTYSIDNGFGSTSGASTVDVIQHDFANEFGDSTIDGMVGEVDQRCMASDGTNVRSLSKRTVFRIMSNAIDVLGTDVIYPSAGSTGLLLVSTSSAASGLVFKVRATGVLGASLDWFCYMNYTLYRPAE